MSQQRGNRRALRGEVIGNKMAKTVVVRVDRTLRHPHYGKVVTLAKKVYAHDESGDLQIGDQVTVVETRPVSTLKRW